MKMIIFILVWIACGVFSYSSALGYFTYKYPWRRNTRFAVRMATLGILSVPASLICGDIHHLRLRPLSTEERWEAFHKEFPSLSKDYFEERDGD